MLTDRVAKLRAGLDGPGEVSLVDRDVAAAALPRQTDRTAAAAAGTLPVQRLPRGPSPPLFLATVLVADPRPATRASLSVGLRDSGIDRVLEADSVAAADEVMAGGLTGDVAVISLEFGADAERLIRDLGRAGWPRLLVTTPSDDPGPVIRAFRAGAGGVLRGPPAMPPAVIDWIPVQRLTDREIEVITLAADGRSNSWIGQYLSLSALTVKSHLARIGRKLGTGDRAHIVAMAMRAGVIR
jgi:DNA-binding NarL/FixJ family response regulator